MRSNMANIITEEVLKSILLCEPITHKGRRCLSDLKLEKKVDEDFFYNNEIWIDSRFSIDEYLIQFDLDDDTLFPYSYESLSNVDVNRKRNECEAFNNRFTSTGEGSSPIVVLGVAGNGKTIAVHRRLRALGLANSRNVFFSYDDMSGGNLFGFTCPNKENLSWVTCHDLLKQIIELIKDNPDICSTIWKNYYEIILPRDNPAQSVQDLFETIREYGTHYQESDNIERTNQTRAVFNKLLAIIDVNQEAINNRKVIKSNLIRLLRLYCILLYCAYPESRFFIVFDNIEECIIVDKKKIQIPDYQVIDFYDGIQKSIQEVISFFNSLKDDDEYFGWNRFKFIHAMRRTSIQQIERITHQHSLSKGRNYMDITGAYSLYSIWKKKRIHILQNQLQNRFPFSDDRKIDINGLSEEERYNTQLIRLVDYILYYNREVMIGTPYQQLISPLMGYGLRRNARAQSHAIIETFSILQNGRIQENIQYTDLFQLIGRYENAKGFREARYLFRQALMEIQFRAQIAGGNRDRWKRLGIGQLQDFMRLDRRTYEVEYYDDLRVSYFRRILSFLYNRTENHNGPTVFPTISLRELVKGIFCDPRNSSLIINKNDLENELLELARVLIAMGNMDYNDTHSAPFVILWVDDPDFHSAYASSYESETRLAEILYELLDCDDNETAIMEKYCVRLTDAGCAFLLLWHGSFSFMAALYCFSLKPLFYLRDPEDIKFVIETVYHSADEICAKYEAEARSFCGGSFDLKRRDCQMLPIEKEIHMTYRNKVKILHQKYLNLYHDYLRKSNRILGFNTSVYNDLLTFVKDYIDRYSDWDNREDGPCF